jgi:hypothetical protein
MKVWDVAVCLSSIEGKSRQVLMARDNRSLEECGIGIVEVRMLYCMSLLTLPRD